METNVVVGLGLSGLGLAGYTVGVFVPYPGRAFTATAVMVGVTLLAVSDWTGGVDG